MSPADLLILARAAGAAGRSWADWQCGDDVQAFADADGFEGQPGRLLIQACEKAFAEGVREHRINGGWIVAWTTAPADYDSMGTETIPADGTATDDAATEGDYHGKPLRRVMMNPKHARYQADRYSSGLHPTWRQDPRILDAAAAERAAKTLADEKTRQASRDRGREWLKSASDAELEAADATTEDEHGFFTTDLREERARREQAAKEAARAAEWARCLAIVPEGCTIVDHGCDAQRGQFGTIPGRPTHVYYNVRIVHGWPDDTEHANVLGEGAFHGSSSTNAGSLAYVADWLTKGEADGFTKKLEIVPVDSVPPRPVLERIGHEHLKDIRRVEAAGRVVWVGRPTFGETLILDEKGHLVRAKKVLEAVKGVKG